MARFPEGIKKELGHARYAETWEAVSHQCQQLTSILTHQHRSGNVDGEGLMHITEERKRAFGRIEDFPDINDYVGTTAAPTERPNSLT